MDAVTFTAGDMAALHQKIDLLTQTVAAQSRQIELLQGQRALQEQPRNGNEALLEKLDFLAGQLEAQSRQQEEWNELKRDLAPIANQMIKLSIDELAEIGYEFQGEDLLFLVKRLLRDTRMLVGLLDRLESTVELADEIQMVGNQAYRQAILTLDRMEREGYFAFARSGWRIVERVVSEFSEEDVNALGENIVTILNTVKSLTQPEMMALTNRALGVIQQPVDQEVPTSTLGLVRELFDPKTRTGLARLVSLLKVLADQPAPAKN